MAEVFRKLPETTSSQTVKRGWRDFLFGALAGFVFSVGLFLVARPEVDNYLRAGLRMLTPAGMTGFFGVLIGEWLRKKARSSLLKYSIYGMIGAVSGAMLFLIVSSSPNIAFTGLGIYFSLWVGGVIGLAVRLSLDEIITESKRKIANENQKPK